MPENSSNTQPPGDEPEKIRGYVKNKIRKLKVLKEEVPVVARARTSQAHVSPEKAQKLNDLLAPHLPAAAKAWVDGLKATKTAWNQQSHQFEDTGLPDHKERRECARAIFEYVVGKPIERSMEVTGTYQELSQLIEDMRNSSEAQRLLGAGFFDNLRCGQSTAEGKESRSSSESETELDSGQKTG